jgi:MATE family multidrug resistance protein
MTSNAIHHRLWHLAWPMMLSNITVPLLGLVDTAVLGHLDNAVYLAGVALSTTLFTSVFWLFGFLRMGTCGMTAQAVGAQNISRVLSLLLSAAWFAFGMGLFLILSSNLWIPFLLELLAGEPTSNTSLASALSNDNSAVIEQAMLYAQWRVLGAPFVLFNYAILGWFVGRQNTKVPLLILVSANLVNMLLDIILVVYMGMSVEGVAIATLCADISAVIIGLACVYFHYRKEISLVPNWLPQWVTIKEMMQVNRYIFVRTGTLLLTFALFTSQGARLGEDYLAANAVLLTFLLLISNALDGFAHGAEALVGEACGQKDQTQLQRVIQTSLFWSAITAVLLFIAFGVGGYALIALLTDIENIRALASDYLPWLVTMPIISVWCYTYDGIFIGATKVRAMQNIMLISTFLIFLPSVALIQLIINNDTSVANHALWLAMTLFMFTRSVGMAMCSRHYSHSRQWF